MNGFNASEKDTKLAERIRRQYLEKEANKIEMLKKLDDKVKAPGKIAASILGVIGALVMGGGMALVMEWGNIALGLGLGIPGMLLALVAYPVYVLITNRRKKKYADEVMHLSREIVGE